ncbi:Vacuolar-sorting-associated 13 protein C-terminal [Phytophthora infestans]|uniref:Vacuolar-sorting-associated 13 protein C-terminal n=1 Tax=Phytophthora infestans TaxID=4787 RepID=A0A833SYH9_PHYIN|nr:Vacuolar-sorting-associated 13 protein C-terminal [Phytophthora infestans]
MLDLLSPLRGYIAQNLQFYLSKYIEDIQLEGFGLFGGDLVLNDLEIKRHVLRESLEIPSSFDFSRGFIRELRIHIPWTQLLSQPIEVKLYTIELILTGKNSAARTSSVDAAVDREAEIDQPKSGWIHDMLQKILANVSVQINNLVLKYEHDDVVFSIALGTLDFYSASESDGWKRSFEELKGGRRAICKRIDAKDVTIFLDRYKSDGAAKEDTRQGTVRRKVVGYEVPVLNRTSVSVRAKLQLFPSAAKDDHRSKSTSPALPMHQQPPVANLDRAEGNILDVDGLFAYRPSVMCDPFYYYSCNRSSVTAMYEVDVFIGKLFFSVSDRQLEMLNQLIQSASRKIDQAHELSYQVRNCNCVRGDGMKAGPSVAPNISVETFQEDEVNTQKVGGTSTKQESWFGWAMNALGAAENEEEDGLVSELLAETSGALLNGQPAASDSGEDMLVPSGPVTKTSCVRVCVSSAFLTLRKHEQEVEVELQDSTIVEDGEEFVPVANLGMVKVSLQTKKQKVARPAVPIFHLTLSYVALEMLLARGQEQSGMDLVFEVEKVELASATTSENLEDMKCKKGEVLLAWGSIDASHFSDCVSHPYFISSFFGEETTRLNQRESRSFEIVKVNLDANIPIWKTVGVEGGRRDSDENSDFPCDCFTTWNGEYIRCIPMTTISRICKHTIRLIGFKERVLDEGILSNAVSTAWASSGFPISISEGVARALSSAADEYRVHRDLDLGALDNLALLLQPQLVTLFSRYALHSCSVASLHPSSGSSNIRHRSVHSAVRMRSASTSSTTEHDVFSPDVHLKEELISKVLDISIGAAQTVLEPSQCLEILEALSIFTRKDDDDGDKSVVECDETPTPTSENVESSIRSIIQSDVKFITASKVHILIPGVHADSKQDSIGVNCRGGLNLIASGFTWLGSFYPGNTKSHLQLGALTTYLERAQNDFTVFPLVEALGFELLSTESSAYAGDNDGLFASLIKLKIDFSLSVAHDAATVINRVSGLFGFPIAWEPMNSPSKRLQTSFQVEVCRAGFSRIVSDRPRLVMAQHQSFNGEVASVSATIKTTKGMSSILQGGVAPMAIRGYKAKVSSFFTFVFAQEKSPGRLDGVPLLGSLGLFSLNPGLLTSTCTQCNLSVQAQLAHVYLDMRGVNQLVGAAQRFVKEITASFSVRKGSIPTLEWSDKVLKEGDSATRVPTNWSVTVDVKVGGGDIRVNEALQSKFSLLSVSSVEKNTVSTDPVNPGGGLKLVLATKGASLCATESGTLAGLDDPMILSIEDVGVSVDISHRYVDYRHTYSIDATLHLSSVKASLSRLKLLYLLKLPFLESEAESRKLVGSDVSTAQKSDKRKDESRAVLRCRWYWRLGAQIDRADFSCTADMYHSSILRRRQIRTVVNGKVLNIGVAARIGNCHPTNNQQQLVARTQFTDIQISVGNIQVVERLQNSRREIRTGFGDFSRLPEHTFMGILVCLDLPELQCLSETFCVSKASVDAQQYLPSVMLSWHLTSSVAKVFQEANAKWHRSEADTNQPTAEIPLIATWNDPALAKTANSFPLLSGFYRNYSEAGFPYRVIAGSMENVDVIVSTSSLYCLASVLDVRGRGLTNPSSVSSANTEMGDPRTKEKPKVSLANVEVSVLLGKVRLILPNESLMDSVLSKQSVVPGNVVLVFESMSLASAVRNEISLDGLGYPPFNSRMLPRRPTLQPQRFGQSQLRIGSRAGKLFGFVADLKFNAEIPTSKSVLDAVGPFEAYMGSGAGFPVRFVNVDTFWSPLNVTCSIEEESVAGTEGNDPGVKITACIALTKLRLDLHKSSFDVLVSRVVGIIGGINSLRRSIATQSQAQSISMHLDKAPEAFVGPECTDQREVAFSCDGIEINLFEMSRSTHIRVGSIILVHNSSTLSGSASIQNLAVGHRTNDNSTSKTVAVEEVVFGVNAEPSLWQLAVENYPEKLIATRWSFGDRLEGTLFLDVQAYQLHASHHFIQALVDFSRTEPDLSFSGQWEQAANESDVRAPDRKPFVLQKRWNIKLLVAPSVMSYWKQNVNNEGKSGVWMKSGQLFASAAVGIDDISLHSLRTYGPAVNDINRFVTVPTLEMLLNVDKFGLNTSNDLPPLEVHFQRDSVGPVATHTVSTWQRFSKYISGVSEAQRLLHDCSVRVTGDHHLMLERVPITGAGVCLLYTDMAQTNVQAEANPLCVKLSSFSLRAIQSLLSAGSGNRLDHSAKDSPDIRSNSEFIIHRSIGPEKFDAPSTDDFKDLRRMAEGRRPLPGELVLTETLLIETKSAVSSCSHPVEDTKVHTLIDPNKYDIELSDVTAFLKDCNKPWGIEEQQEASGERPSYNNKTHSWMGMRWCYHIPRKVCKIVAAPVPIPPNGVPNGWPSWNWNQDQEDDTSRLCDILCQLRYWDSKKSCYVVVCEFFVPWEDASANVSTNKLDNANEPGSFGELMFQWFDDDMEETRYRAKMREFGARTRAYTFNNEMPSDNWELRWRAPLHSEQEPENKQKRLVVNALLASSLQVHSVLTCDAYQRVVSNVTLPQVTLSVSHVGSENESHDIITAELNDTDIACAVSGHPHTRTLIVRVSSAIQVYLDNMVQLLTVSVVPRTTIDAMVEVSSKGIGVSTLIGPVSLYLNQTAILVISAIPKLLQAKPKQSQAITASPDKRMSSMRIRIVNHTGVDIWYRQEGTSECLLLPSDSSSAYSWLSLASNPFYQLRFAMDDPREKLLDKMHADDVSAEQEDPRWCDPCRIKENAVTGRYFGGHGFVWICVELCGLQTMVTLRSSLTVRNYCEFRVRIKVNNDGAEHDCARSDDLYRGAPETRTRVYHHPSCISLDGSACTLSATTRRGDTIAYIMAESVTTLSFGTDGGSWCNEDTLGILPSEFDLVKMSDNEAISAKKAQCTFTALHSKSPDEQTHYVWAKIARVQCKTVLPTDFDALQPHLSGRYTWMEMSLWPAITVENIMDVPIVLSFSQKLATATVHVPPASEKSLSTINPYEPVDTQLQYDQGMSNAESLDFLLQCSSAKDPKDQVFVFEGCKVLVSFCNDHRPMIRVRTERILSVANMTPSDLNISIGSPLGAQGGGAMERIGSCDERSIGFAVVSNRLVIAIATVEASSSASNHIEWSPEVALNVKGDTKPIVVPPAQAGLRSLASVYCIELVNSDGYLKLIIRPQVVVINSTNGDLKCAPTDGRGNALVEDGRSSVVAGSNSGWSVPVCLHKEANKRSITADMSSWLSSKLSRRPSKDPLKTAKQAMVARLSCSFRVTLMEDGYEWTEEITVMLPKIPLLLTSDGKLRIAEPETSSAGPTNTQIGLYPAPSTTTYRRRLLIRHRDFRHKALTYTITQKEKSIHIIFFVDHQPPVIIHNQWENMLGFRNVSFPSDPEGVGADYYLEYDWSLQVSAKHREATTEESDAGEKERDAESKLLRDWLEASSQFYENADASGTTTSERMRFQIGLPQYGWSNSLWQVGGIQFASFSTEDGIAPTFLVMCFYRVGSWLISITCLEDPTRDGQVNPTPSLMLPSVASPAEVDKAVPAYLKVGVVVEELSLHFCDEHDPLRDARGMILYPEILRATCNAVSIVFATAPDPPEISRHSARLGYLSHIRSYTTLFVAVEDIEVGHFLQTCNFPVILHFPESHASKNSLHFDRVKKQENLGSLMGKLLDKQLPGAEHACLIARIIYTDTWDPVGIPSYFHSIELKLSPAVLQVEDDILTYVNSFVQPLFAAAEGEAAVRAMHDKEDRKIAPRDAWSLHAYESVVVTTQRKVYIEWLRISNLQVTITARVSIPVLNSFDGTPLYFGPTEMREVFSFPDQLIKDLAADYVADTIVRSPMLLMSLNIIGNPAGFLRSFGQGVRDLVEIPLAASRKGYSPWILTKGVVGGVASFLGHTTAATLTSVSGFSYSISRTMDQLTLPPEQLRKRHYTRPTHLSSALADGLGSLGSSVVGAAAGVITTPIAVYKERQLQGLDTGIRNVVGGVGMGLVGIVARPMGGVASLVSMASDGLLYEMGGSRTPFDDSASRFDARPNELLRYKLKVLRGAIGSSLLIAHGIWVIPVGNLLLVSEQELDYISEQQLETPENEPLRELLLARDITHRLVQVTVVCSSECIYVVGVSGAQNQVVLVRTPLKSIEAVEESLKEPTVFDLGVKMPASAEWLRFRLPPRQRRHLSHQLRLWLAKDSIV